MATLSANEKLLYLYLLTNPHTNLCGMYKVSIRYIAFETGLTLTQVKDALATFSAAGKVLYEQEWVILVNHQKHQTASPKIQAGIKREMSEIPQGVANLRYGIDRVSIGIDKPVPKLEPKLRLNISCSSKTMNDTDFDIFWTAYPKKKGKGGAKKKFLKLSKELLPVILEAIKKQKASKEWEDPQFIKHPITWLNNGCWEDEVDTPTPVDLKAEYEKIGLSAFEKKYGMKILASVVNS